MADTGVPTRALVVGLAVTGEAVARQLLRRGHEVVAVDDRPGPAMNAMAAALGIELAAPDRLAELVAAAGVVLPSPGVPARHPVFELAARAGVPVWSELELAARWSDLPVVAITGTNGKTTVTTLVTEMLQQGGRRTIAAGNTDVPLVDVLDRGLDVAVVEASSFRLQLTETFRPAVGAWLNLAEDHLDWHRSMDEYVAAKTRVWANHAGDDVAVANADDPVVAAAARTLGGRVEWFSVAGNVAQWRLDPDAGTLVGPAGTLVKTTDLPRRMPHDLANALAAAASAAAVGVAPDVCREVLVGFDGLAHRVALVAESDEVRWYDDSKATTPASVMAAVSGFASVVLIAGGRNKGLDLSVLRSTVPPVRAVIAIGDAAGEVDAAFAGSGAPVTVAHDMAEAVGSAAKVARPGDAVVLSPGCASFDWYRDYTERGDDFARLVLELTGAEPAPVLPGGGH
jgi:UDP-N-acetylmuramoylalanine--D-glutamate ligase